MTRISRPRSGPPSAAITSSIGLLAGVVWLALPELALANDCFTAGEVLACVLTTPPVLLGLLSAAFIGAALWGAMSGPAPPEIPTPPPDTPPPLVYPDKVYEPSPDDFETNGPEPGDPDYPDEGM